MEVLRWVLVCVIGLLTGLVAFLIDICVKELFKVKYHVFGNGKNSGLEKSLSLCGLRLPKY